MKNKFNEIDIKINKARISELYIEFRPEDDLPRVTVIGKLITTQGLEISDFRFYTDSFGEKSKIEVPAYAHSIISDLFTTLTPVVYEKINGMVKQIGEPKNGK